jgi:hypothetical protein
MNIFTGTGVRGYVDGYESTWMGPTEMIWDSISKSLFVVDEYKIRRINKH